MRNIKDLISCVSKGAFLAIFLVLPGSPFTSRAAIANINVGKNDDDMFSPLITRISVNDQVLWSWDIDFHSTTSGTNGQPSGLWDTGVHSSTPHATYRFLNSFPKAGTFVFYCSVHYANGMTGAVVVAAANLPPAVSITNPAAGAVFAAPANVTVQASASDNDGTVTNVQFLVGASVVANQATPPYSAVINNLAAGSYSLFAVATDSGGATSTNRVAISVITPASLLLSAPAPVSPGKFRFSYTANTGLSYVVESSSNLLLPYWSILITNQAAGGVVNFTDQNASFKSQFYRVGRMPNP